MTKKQTGPLESRLEDCQTKFAHVRQLENRGHKALRETLYDVYQIEKDIRSNAELVVELNQILKRKGIRRSKNRVHSLIKSCYSSFLPPLGTPERKNVLNRISEYSKRINDALRAEINMDLPTFSKFQGSWRTELKKDTAKLDIDQSEQPEWIRGTGTWIGFPNAKIYREFCKALRNPAFHHVDLRICVLNGRAVVMRVHAPERAAEIHPFPSARYLRQKI